MIVPDRYIDSYSAIEFEKLPFVSKGSFLHTIKSYIVIQNVIIHQIYVKYQIKYFYFSYLILGVKLLKFIHYFYNIFIFVS